MELEEMLSSAAYDVVRIVTNGREAVTWAQILNPDLVLMDIKMPDNIDGISAAEKIIERRKVPIIFVTGHDDRDLLRRAADVNPAGYILKPYATKQIVVTIEMAVQRARNSAPEDTRYKIRYNNTNSAFSHLTQAELRVAELIRSGLSSKEISELLNISKKTVDWHRANIRSKMRMSRGENLFIRLRNL